MKYCIVKDISLSDFGCKELSITETKMLLENRLILLSEDSFKPEHYKY